MWRLRSSIPLARAFATVPSPSPSSSSTKRLDKVLIANRGEIACRIMKTAKKMGVRTVAVYSDADVHSAHVQMADEAFRIGPAASSESYLKMQTIIDVAKSTGAQGIHPGYGFLSENASFADLCAKNNVIFIGPPGSAIRDMGSKSESKIIMERSNVPCVKGYHGEDQSDERLLAESKKIGFPVLIKAVKGGGGKGMRIVHSEKEFAEALASARREALKSFSDDTVLVEKYITRPRHVEFQVFADTHGNAVYLFERDCSVQRRHQKVIEEAPAPFLSPEVRESMGQAAVRAAKAVGYVGAGTVEFIFDTADNSFYFMEMNTRLQVEHPVTEMITGVDLVQWQLMVAAGHPLPCTQDQLSINGHSFESRIYAENPEKNFLPGTGPLVYLRAPANASDVRVETGVRQGDEVSVHYDPMIAKLVVWGPDRASALGKMHDRLREYNIVGLHTNINFLRNLTTNPNFMSAADLSTKFIEENKEALLKPVPVSPSVIGQAVLAILLTEGVNPSQQDPWGSMNAFRPFDHLSRVVHVTIQNKDYEVHVRYGDHGKFHLKWDGVHEFTIEGRLNGDQLVCHTNHQQYNTTVVEHHNDIHLFTLEGEIVASRTVPGFLAGDGAALGSNALIAPMTGKIEKIHVKAGDKVVKDQALIVMEAMKMEMVLRAPRDGVIASLSCEEKTLAQQNSVLLKLVE